MTELNFNRVTYDDELSEFDKDELVELAREFEEAQESNVAEFERAAEALDGVDEQSISEFEEARESLVDEIVEADDFSEVPLSEEQLGDCSFDQLREWKEFVADSTEDSDNDEDGDGSEADFEDMGNQGPTHEEADDAEFADEHLGDVPGLVISD